MFHLAFGSLRETPGIDIKAVPFRVQYPRTVLVSIDALTTTGTLAPFSSRGYERVVEKIQYSACPTCTCKIVPARRTRAFAGQIDRLHSVPAEFAGALDKTSHILKERERDGDTRNIFSFASQLSDLSQTNQANKQKRAV